MGKLFVFRGLPGSGKTTRARTMQNEHGGVVVERDEIRRMLYGVYYNPRVIDEKLVTEYQNLIIDTSLQMRMNVYVSDMNLRNAYVRALIEKAQKFDVEWEIVDLTNVDVTDCVYRDVGREKSVGHEFITELWRRYIKGRPYPLPVTLTADNTRPKLGRMPYLRTEGLPKAIIVDIDGTVARMNGRGPFEEDKVMHDLPIKNVIDMVTHACAYGVSVVFMSGRTDACYNDTSAWLRKNLPFLNYNPHMWELHMRRSVEDRGRPDDDVKYDLFFEHVARRFDVLYVLDDRDKVVKMWRDIGLTCAQVNYGNF